jgi:neutral ceramidase
MSKPSSYAAPAVPGLLLLLLSTTVVATITKHSAASTSGVPFLVGIGKADVTGPAADVNMMGYALLEQTARGLHTRQHARAYLVADSAQQ